MDLKILNKEINNVKESLYILMTDNKLTDTNVVECSQKLDKLILEYQKYEKL
jgi:hypothetical protein